MRVRALAAAVVSLVLAADDSRSDPPAGQVEARALIEWAVKAHGGAEKLAKLRAVRRKMKGTLWVNGEAVPVAVERIDQLPGRSRVTQELEFEGQPVTIVSVLNGGKAWNSFNGDTQEARAEFRARRQEEMHALLVESLVPLLKRRGFGLAHLGEIKVSGRAAVGVKVTAEGRPDVDLYFDKGSGLLVKSAYRGQDEFEREVLRECFLSAYKETAGLKRPTKFQVLQDGVKASEHEVVETTFEEKFEESEFAKP